MAKKRQDFLSGRINTHGDEKVCSKSWRADIREEHQWSARGDDTSPPPLPEKYKIDEYLFGKLIFK